MTTTTTNIQLRGHCQRCGRQQAVVRGDIAKHGYEVADGYFQGVCAGHHFAPIEADRAESDRVIVSVRQDADAMRALASDLTNGTKKPATAQASFTRDPRTRDYERCAFADAPEHFQQEAIRSAIFTATRRAEMADSFADKLGRLCDEFHGKPLLEVVRAEAPAPITYGERRLIARGGVATVRSVRGATVSWIDERGFVGKTSTRSWRALPLAT